MMVMFPYHAQMPNDLRSWIVWVILSLAITALVAVGARKGWF